MRMHIKRRKNIKSVKGTLFAIAVGVCFTFFGCGEADNENTTVKNVNIQDIHSSVKEAYGDEYVPSYEFDAEYINEVFGLSEDLYDEIIAEGPKVAFDIDTFIAVKAKEGKGEEVYKLLSEYREDQINDAMQYPVNAIKIQASNVKKYGDYVFFTCLGTISEESQNNGDEAILEEAKKDNEIAVKKIEEFFK